MCKWANVQMGKWANMQMGKYANGQMGRSAHIQIRFTTSKNSLIIIAVAPHM